MKYKYRAYIKALKLMLYGVDVYANGMIGIAIDKLTLPKDHYIDEGRGCIMETNGDEDSHDYHVMNILEGEDYIWFEQGQFELMQGTGLKDKGNKEIYAGSLIGVNLSNEKHMIFSVHFGDTFEFMKDGYYGWYLKYESGNYDGIQEHYCQLNSSCESTTYIVGDLYQTPELLK